jgi:hypothetical protein
MMTCTLHELVRLRAELDEARADTERLDWLEKQGMRPVSWKYQVDGVMWDVYSPAAKFQVPTLAIVPPLREAIDAAMEKEQQQAARPGGK